MKRFILMVSSGLFITAVLVLAAEGLSSFINTFTRVSSHELAERRHTEYDELLGWINIPGVQIPDMYGPGRSLKINSQRFRAEKDFEPERKNRIICLGDSYTFGYGVSDSDPWCRRLMDLKPGTETINMGQCGYGIDQAYLWYKRDGVKFSHERLIFAFITDDISRMTSEGFNGYGKPALILKDGKLSVKNVPVPRTGAYRSYLRKWTDLAAGLNLSILLYGEPFDLRNDEGLVAPSGVGMPLAIQAFEELSKLNPKVEVDFVWLPEGLSDYRNPRAAGLRKTFESEMKRHGLSLIDLTVSFDRLEPGEIDAYFIQPGEVPYFAAEGHLSAKGNELVARELSTRLSRP